MRGLLLSLIGTTVVVMSATLAGPSAALAQIAVGHRYEDPPNGIYLYSCSNAHVDVVFIGNHIIDKILTANCKTGDGSSRPARLRQPSDCNDIENEQGVLYCYYKDPNYGGRFLSRTE